MTASSREPDVREAGREEVGNQFKEGREAEPLRADTGRSCTPGVQTTALEGGAPVCPWLGRLELSGQPNEQRFAAERGDKLHAERQALRGLIQRQ